MMAATLVIAAPSSGPASPRAGKYAFAAGGFDVLGVLVVNLLLVVFTLGIAGLFGVPGSRLQYFVITHTTRAGRGFQYQAGVVESVLASIGRKLLLVCTLGLAWPWTLVMRERFRVDHTSTAEGHRMSFTGTGFDVIGLWLLTLVCLPLSCGLAWPWLAVVWQRWTASSTVIHDPNVPGRECQLRFDAGGLSYFVQGTLSLLLSVITFGLYAPWAIASYQQFVWSSMSDTVSDPVEVPAGPRTPGQWALVGMSGAGVASIAVLCLAFAVLPALGGNHGAAAVGGWRGDVVAGSGEEDEGYDDDEGDPCLGACDLDCDGAISRHESAVCDQAPASPGGAASSSGVPSPTEQWFRVGAALRLRAGPSEEAPVLTTMPRGAFVRALIGIVDGHQSATGSHGTWARVFPTGQRAGWAGGNLLAPTRTSAPEARQLLGQLDAPLRDEAAADAFVGDLSTEGEPLWYVAACAASEPAVYVGLRFGYDGGAPALSRTEGTYEDLAFIRRPESARSAFVLLATQRADAPPGTVRWTLFAPGSTVPGWTVDAPTGRAVPELQRARFDIMAPRSDPTRVVRFRFADHSTVIVRSDGRTFTSERTLE